MKNTEIERKFLVCSDEYRHLAVSHSEIVQAYLMCDNERSLRVRTRGGQAFITFKANSSSGIGRFEWEREIPLEDAQALIGQALPGIIEKTRHIVEYNGRTWEIDEFHGNNEGLTVAEIELEDENETFDRPAWLGEEVTGDPAYLNCNLAQSHRHPVASAPRLSQAPCAPDAQT